PPSAVPAQEAAEGIAIIDAALGALRL
ncbi:hypothetical protein, partial [Mycetocola reblochoni]